MELILRFPCSGVPVGTHVNRDAPKFKHRNEKTQWATIHPSLVGSCSRGLHPLWCNRQKWMLQMNYLPSGLNGLSLTPCERHLADVARIVAGGRNVLYHGTRYTRQILTEGVLRFPTIGLEAVSLSRLPEVAIYSAVLPREDTFDSPSILVLDRETLRSRYRLETYHEGWPGHDSDWRDEAEEIIYRRNVDDLESHLIGVISADLLPDLACTNCTRGMRRYCSRFSADTLQLQCSES